jgi:hypothetical protein
MHGSLTVSVAPFLVIPMPGPVPARRQLSGGGVPALRRHSYEYLSVFLAIPWVLLWFP